MNGASSSSLRITFVWFGLMTATMLSWLLGHRLGFNNQLLSGACILIIGILKIRYVMLDFMELRRAPVPIRIAVEVWTLSAAVAMSALYLHK